MIAKLVDPPVHRREGILHNVLGRGHVVDESGRQAHHRPPLRLIERLEVDGGFIRRTGCRCSCHVPSQARPDDS
jgi:hypothetical protein